MSASRSERGSMSLTAFASVSGGVLFALVFTNLVRYVNVENALEQAMQKAARCIDPSDAACVTGASLSTPQEFDWFRRPTGQAETRWADRYNYSGRVFKENWELRFPAFEVHRIPLPNVEWEEWTLPVARFEARLNTLERRALHVTAQFDPAQSFFFSPFADPNFPEFDPRYEEDRKDQEPALWSPRALNVRADVRPGGTEEYVSHDSKLPSLPPWEQSNIRLSDESRELRSGAEEVVEVVSDWYEVPVLDTSGIEHPVCLFNGKPCSSLSDVTGGQLDWVNNAYVAVKAFAVVRRISGSPEIKWAGSVTNRFAPDGYGLALETVSPQLWQRSKVEALSSGQDISRLPLSSSSTSTECLGGRDWAEVDKADGWKNFHLVLRGAVKRHPSDNSPDGDGIADARDPVCPNGDRKHWALSVPRGGAYRIHGWLKVRGGTVEASVMFKHYFDDYQRVETNAQPLLCDTTVPVSGETNETICQTACSEKLSQGGYRTTPKSCSVEEVREPLCETDLTSRFDPTIVQVSRSDRCADGIFSAAVCETNQTDRLPLCRLELASFPGSKLCLHKIADEGSVAIPAQSVSCPLAEKSIRSVSCEDGRAEADWGPPESFGDSNRCPSVVRTMESSGSPQLMAQGALMSIRPSPSRWAAAREFEPQKWVRTLTPPAHPEPNAVRAIEAVVSTSRPWYATSAGRTAPMLSDFPLNSSELEVLTAGKNYSIANGGVTPLEIQSAYPFHRKPEFEIALTIPEKDGGCAGESAELETRLRSYAAAEIPEAADPRVLFEGSAEYVDSQPIEKTDGCQNVSRLSDAPPCTRISYVERETEACGNTVYLGRYGTEAYPDGPPICRQDASSCFSSVVLTDQPNRPAEAFFELDKAKSEGVDELRRFLPQTPTECDGPGCARLEISVSDPIMTNITASYRLPLTFPLSQIMGRDYLLIEKSKVEPRVLAYAGRQERKE